jgi:3-deoxy-D-arabino-heptulosonate 7-phosphate (DAHP) synthase
MEPVQQTHDVRTFRVGALESPRKIKEDFIASRDPIEFVTESRNTISSLLSRSDTKLVVVAEPCYAQNETFAIDSTVAARHSPTFLRINQKSPTSAVRTAVNEQFHIIAPSGRNGSNYGLNQISQIVKLSISSRIGAYPDD